MWTSNCVTNEQVLAGRDVLLPTISQYNFKILFIHDALVTGSGPETTGIWRKH